MDPLQKTVLGHLLAFTKIIPFSIKIFKRAGKFNLTLLSRQYARGIRDFNPNLDPDEGPSKQVPRRKWKPDSDTFLDTLSTLEVIFATAKFQLQNCLHDNIMHGLDKIFCVKTQILKIDMVFWTV